MAWSDDRDGSAGYATVTTLATAVDEAVPFVVVYLSDLHADWHAAMAAASDTDGKTIRVSTADGATQLPCVPIGVNTGTDTGCLIFLGTGMSASVDVDYRIYVGNASLSMPSASGGMGEQAVFASYAGVYFPGVATRDWTAGGRTLTAVNSPGTAASGYEGITAATYNGTTQGHYYSGTQSVTNWPITMESLSRSATTSSNQGVVGFFKNSDSMPQAYVSFTSSAKINTVYRGDGGGASVPTTSASFAANTDYYLASSRDANTGTAKIYVDSTATTNSDGISAPTFDTLSIGYLKLGSPLFFLNGRVAVALLSSSVRSADYVSTMQDNWAGAMYSAGTWTPNSISAGTTGLVLFQSIAQSTSAGADWSNISDAIVDDSNTADVTLDDAGVYESEYLNFTNPDYGTTIPTGAPDYTVKFYIKRKSDTSAAKEVQDLTVQFIDDTGTRIGDNMAATLTDWTSTLFTAEYTVTGLTLDGTEFTSAAGMALRVTGWNTNGSTLAEVACAWMEVSWAGTANTGTGALTAPAGTASGSGVVGKTGTGALTAPVATVSGAGTSTHVATGALTAPVATVSGAGVAGKSGTGALTAPAATVSGVGGVGRTGTGELTAPAATVSGAGTQTVSGTGALDAPAGEVDGSGTGSGSIPVSGTGALDAPMPSVSGAGEIQSGNQDLVGDLTAPAGEVAGTAITGKTGTAALVHPMPIVSGSGRSTVSGTGALVAPSTYIIAGIGLNSPPGIVGTGSLTAPAGEIDGTGYVLGSTDLSVDYLSWYTTGASAVGRSQRSQSASLGGNRSSTEAKSMTWECRDPMIGVEILAVSALNGRGHGSLAAVTESTLSWTPPGGTEGTAVTLASGDEAMLFGFNSDAWIRVRRISTIPMSGAHAVQCLDVYNNLIGMGNVASADAVAGKTYYRSIMAHNPFAGPAINVKIWLDSDANDNIAIGYEAAVAGAIQTIASETTAPTGITWVTGITSATGITIPSLEAGASFGLWMRRTIAADSDPSPSELNHVHVQFEDLATNTRLDDLRGKYRIARNDFVTYGLWLGQDTEPDLTGAADVEFASRPYTTTLNYDEGHTYNAVIRQRNKWGLWSQNATSTPLVMLAGGSQGFVPPTAPTDILIAQTADDEAIVSGRYEPVVDTALANAATNDPGRAEIFVLWMTTDGSAPDVTDPPTAYQLMGRRAGVEIFKYTDTGNSLLDGTPIKAIVRTRRLTIGAGDVFSPDTTQLPASGAGTIVVASELAGWDSSGYMKVTSFSGALQEIVAYSSLVVGTGISTFTVLSGGRAQWGTTAAATATNTVIYPVTATDSTNTTVATDTIDGIAPGRPWGELFFGNKDAQAQTPIEGPDGVTEEYIDVTDNIYLLLGEGWTELWMDTDLVWKVFQDGTNYADNALYIPSEWTIVTGAVSGASTGVFDAVDAANLYIVSGGVRRVHIDTAAMTITMPSLSTLGGLPEVAPQVASWEQYAGSLLQSWDPSRSDYRPYVQVSSTGTMTSEWTIKNTLTQAEIVAL